MKQKYIQPTMLVVEIESSAIMAISRENGQIDVPMGGTTYEFDAPRTRLWGGDED